MRADAAVEGQFPLSSSENHFICDPISLKQIELHKAMVEKKTRLLEIVLVYLFNRYYYSQTLLLG